jgi:hypothetical protein
MDVTSLADRVWPVVRLLVDAHVRIYRVSNGRVGRRFLGGAPILLLDHVGAKTANTPPRSYTSRTTVTWFREGMQPIAFVSATSP